MRSIVEEASTVQKAIAKAWDRAGQPREFTAKVLELPVYNFFGMTKRSAKIALYFSPLVEKKEPKRRRREQPKREQASKQVRQLPRTQHKAPTEQKQESVWTDEMVDAAQKWLKGTLAIQKTPPIPITCEAKRKTLVVSFLKPLIEDKQSEDFAFAGLSHLLVKALRKQFKEGARHIRVTLKRV